MTRFPLFRALPALSMLAAVLLVAVPLVGGRTAAAPPTRPWTAVASPVATGSFLIGNPKARVKLVEYVSYTCPHCGHFVAESGPTLKAMVRSGSTSIEVRNQIHDKFDLATATLARCAGPTIFPALHEAIFTGQAEWEDRASEWSEVNAQRISVWPQLAQLRALLDGAGLTAIARTAGMTDAAIDQCFATDATVRRVLAVSNGTAKVSGTPAFEINGRLMQNVGWKQLEPMLRAAGAK
jgi:protein-disulfide isomerase